MPDTATRSKYARRVPVLGTCPRGPALGESSSGSRWPLRVPTLCTVFRLHSLYSGHLLEALASGTRSGCPLRVSAPHIVTRVSLQVPKLQYWRQHRVPGFLTRSRHPFRTVTTGIYSRFSTSGTRYPFRIPLWASAPGCCGCPTRYPNQHLCWCARRYLKWHSKWHSSISFGMNPRKQHATHIIHFTWYTGM